MKPGSALLVDLDGTLINEPGLPMGVEFLWKSIRILGAEMGWRKAIRAFKAAIGAIEQQEEEAGSKARKVNSQRAVLAMAQVAGISEDRAELLLRGCVEKVFPTLRRHFAPIVD